MSQVGSRWPSDLRRSTYKPDVPLAAHHVLPHFALVAAVSCGALAGLLQEEQRNLLQGCDQCQPGCCLCFLPDALQEEQRSLLKFVTSCSRAPLGGFKHLNPPLTIHKASTHVGSLGCASTCPELLLPMPLRRLSTLSLLLLQSCRPPSRLAAFYAPGRRSLHTSAAAADICRWTAAPRCWLRWAARMWTGCPPPPPAPTPSRRGGRQPRGGG